SSANLVLLDWLTSGRHAVGERWAFRRYENRIDVHRAGHRILHDAIALNMRDGSIAERMSSCDVLLTAIMTGPMFSTEAGPAIERVNREFAKDPNLICAAWPLASDGAFIRVAGRQLEPVAAMVHEVFAFLSNVLGSGPWTREWGSMHLTPHEADKPGVQQAGFLAQKRLARGLRLNYPEAVALIATQLLEFIRDGRTVAELMDLGRQLLGRADVMERVPEMIAEVQVEGTFPDGTKLVTVHHPIVVER